MGAWEWRLVQGPQVWEKVESPNGPWGRIIPTQGNQFSTHCLPVFLFFSFSSLTLNRLLQPQGLSIWCPLWLEHPFPRSLHTGSLWSHRSNANVTAPWRLPLLTHHIWTLYPTVLHCFVPHDLKSLCSSLFILSLPPLEWKAVNMGTLHGIHSVSP